MAKKKYQTADTGIVRVSDGAFIPHDPNNLDYADYLTWVAAGNEPDPFLVEPQPEAGSPQPGRRPRRTR